MTTCNLLLEKSGPNEQLIAETYTTWMQTVFLLSQEAKKCRYRFSLLLDELRAAETSTYKTTLLAFINCIIISTEKLEERVRIRNEFIGK